MDGNRVERLTPQQFACVRMISTHHTNKAIAAALGLSPKTVENHIAAARLVLGVSDRYAAATVVAAFDHARGNHPRHKPPMVDPPAALAGIESDNAPLDRLRDVAFDPDLFGSHFERVRADRSPEGVTHAPLRTIALIFAIAAAILVLIVAAVPTVQAWSALANAIQPFQH